MFIDWRVISGYFLGYLFIYIMTHTGLDVIMLFKHPGTAQYPYPNSQNILAITCFCLSTILFWLSLIIIPIRSLISMSDIYNSNLLDAPLEPIIRLIGMIIMTFGLIVGMLGRWARGDYKAHHKVKLQKRLGFAFVRHPNYFQYICGFIGVPLISLHLFTLILPLTGIYGYYIIAKEEETRLTLEFGEEYQEYQRNVGMLFPKLSFMAQKKKRISLILKKIKTKTQNMIGNPIKLHQKENRNWIDKILVNLKEFNIDSKAKKKFPSHPYYSSDERKGNFEHQLYSQILR